MEDPANDLKIAMEKQGIPEGEFIVPEEGVALGYN
jgi:hypothetical protein